MKTNYANEQKNLIQHALQLSSEMVDMAEKQEWDMLINHNSIYLPVVERIVNDIDTYTECSEEYVADSLTSLCQNEKHVMSLINNRMGELRKSVINLRNNKEGNNAYANHFMKIY